MTNPSIKRLLLNLFLYIVVSVITSFYKSAISDEVFLFYFIIDLFLILIVFQFYIGLIYPLLSKKSFIRNIFEDFKYQIFSISEILEAGIEIRDKESNKGSSNGIYVLVKNNARTTRNVPSFINEIPISIRSIKNANNTEENIIHCNKDYLELKKPSIILKYWKVKKIGLIIAEILIFYYFICLSISVYDNQHIELLLLNIILVSWILLILKDYMKLHYNPESIYSKKKYKKEMTYYRVSFLFTILLFGIYVLLFAELHVFDFANENWNLVIIISFLGILLSLKMISLNLIGKKIRSKENTIKTMKKDIRNNLILKKYVYGAGIEQNKNDGSIMRIIAYVGEVFEVTPEIPQTLNNHPIIFCKITRENLERANHIAIDGNYISDFDYFSMKKAI